MPCPVPKYRPTFSSEELDRARDVVSRRNAPHAMVQRAKLALLLAEAPAMTCAEAGRRLDVGCSHHRSTFPARLREMYPNAVAVGLPVHARGLNQVEIYFSILQRKVLTPSDFLAPRRGGRATR